jgi:hypothetical protein
MQITSCYRQSIIEFPVGDAMVKYYEMLIQLVFWDLEFEKSEGLQFKSIMDEIRK